MDTLLIDIETYSSVDLTKSGLYRYVESEDFAITLFSYSIDGAKAVIVDFASGEMLPPAIHEAIFDSTVLKLAHNMAFEIVCLSKYFGIEIDPWQWQDTMVLSAYLGLPLSLDAVGKVLRLSEQKSATGTRLINIFSKPNSKGVRVHPEDKPTEWEDFKAYCLQDVDTEVALYKKVNGRVPIPSWERELQMADFVINRRGVRIDDNLARNAVAFWVRVEQQLTEEMKRITGLENPNSVTQLKAWLRSKGETADSLDKVAVSDMLKKAILSNVKRVLEIRLELGKTSVKKYVAMLCCQCNDGRAHGITQYYGTVTGRWSGRMIQTQNLPQNHIPDLEYARRLLAEGDYEGMEMTYGSIPDTLSQLIRTALVPSPGRVFHVCDFSAIECRVIAWLAGENWVLDVFRKDGDIYCATASQMFGIPVEKHGVNAEYRQKGKIATLALGYQGSLGSLKAMGGDRMGLTDKEMKDIVRKWRNANPHIVKLWDIVERAAISTIETGQPHTINRGVTFSMRYGFLFVTLPSGRSIAYPRAKIVEEDDRLQVSYERTDQETKRWERSRTYGGKMVENIVQAIARDILGVIILRCESAGLPIVFHVHDEVIIDSTPDRSLSEIETLFSLPIPWAPGLPLKGSGYTTPFYKKD